MRNARIELAQAGNPTIDSFEMTGEREAGFGRGLETFGLVRSPIDRHGEFGSLSNKITVDIFRPLPNDEAVKRAVRGCVDGQRPRHIAHVARGNIIQEAPFRMESIAWIARVVIVRFQHGGLATFEVHTEDPVVAAAGERLKAFRSPEAGAIGERSGQLMRQIIHRGHRTATR